MYGHYIHEAVKANNETETGITIHYVDKVCDGGGLKFQPVTSVSPDDTPDDIADSVRILEHQYFPKVIEETIKKNVS